MNDKETIHLYVDEIVKKFDAVVRSIFTQRKHIEKYIVIKLLYYIKYSKCEFNYKLNE